MSTPISQVENNVYSHILGINNVYSHILDINNVYSHILGINNVYSHILGINNVYSHILGRKQCLPPVCSKRKGLQYPGQNWKVYLINMGILAALQYMPVCLYACICLQYACMPMSMSPNLPNPFCQTQGGSAIVGIGERGEVWSNKGGGGGERDFKYVNFICFNEKLK